MKNHGKFLYNTAVLTVSNVVMRCISLAFQIWLAGRIGSAGIGLFQLVMSVGGFAMTFAISGIRFGTTRLVAEELGRGSTRGAVAAVGRCVCYALCFGCAAWWVLFSHAERIGFLWVGDARTVLSLRIMAFEMPFVALSSVLSGYFTACGRVTKPAVVHFLEQLICVSLTAVFLFLTPAGDVERSCACVTLAGAAADGVSFLMMLGVWIHDVHTHDRSGPNPRRLTPRLLGISLPLAISAYTRSGLSTLEHMLIPTRLRASGMTAAQALSVYGIIHGMALTVVTFPACVMQVIAELVVPDLTELQVRGQWERIRSTCTGLLRRTLLYSACAAAVLMVFADQISAAIYKADDVGLYIRILTPLMPVMFADIVVDGCLKGLGEHLWCMVINIVESAVSVVLVYTLVPRFALGAFIFILYFDEILNFLLSISRLIRVTRAPADCNCAPGLL